MLRICGKCGIFILKKELVVPSHLLLEAHRKKYLIDLASPIKLLAIECEQILIHGDLDLHVLVELSVEYYRKAIEQGNTVCLFVLPEVEHFKIINPSSSSWKTVTCALETLFGL